jgi:hypothetical protein
MRARFSGVLAAGMLAGAGASAETVELEPGLWRLDTATTTNGAADPAQHTQACLRSEELKDLGAYFTPVLEEAEADCKTTQQSATDPRRLDYAMHCAGAGFTVDAKTDVTIESPRRFRANVRIETRTERESAVVVAEVEGNRAGECPPPEAAPSPAPGASP